MALDSAEQIQSYDVWAARPLVDVRNASRKQLVAGLTEIIETEGPMLALRAYQSFVKAGGVNRVGPAIRIQFDRAVAEMVEAGDLIASNEFEVDDSRQLVLRLPSQPVVRLRTLGDRVFAEIPPSELAEVMLMIRSAHELMGREELYREILAHYGLLKITAPVRSTLDYVLARYF